MYKERILTARLRKLMDAFPVVLVSGARQVGKTTLLRHVFPDHDYAVFDPSIDLENARSEPDLFLRNHPPPVVLDEIQYAPELISAIKRHVDASNARPGLYLMSGSQQWQVFQSLAESLAGRAAFLDLRGFSLQELTGAGASPCWLTGWLHDPHAFVEQARQTNTRFTGALWDWLWRGFLARVNDLDEELVPEFWMGYHRTYVERDGVLYPFEMKLTANPSARDASGLTAFRRAHQDLQIGAAAILCAVDRPRWITEDTAGIPWNAT
ncbi:MAG: hypothetical protein FJ280_27945 [Planctomycetes bacterium]|nr:hypothetical protein [Planctomycetota bacterium]